MANKIKAVLDFGSEKLTVLLGSRDVNNAINVVSVNQEFYEGFSDGEFLQPNLLANSIENVLKQNKIVMLKLKIW